MMFSQTSLNSCLRSQAYQWVTGLALILICLLIDVLACGLLLQGAFSAPK